MLPDYPSPFNNLLSSEATDTAKSLYANVSDGDATSWVTLSKAMLESEDGGPAPGSRPSPTDREGDDCVESWRERPNEDTGHDGDFITTARCSQYSSGYLHAEGHNGNVPVSNNSSNMPDGSEVVGKPQQLKLTWAGSNAQESTTTATVLSQKRRRSGLSEPPSENLDGCDGQTFGQMKVAFSRPSRSHCAPSSGQSLTDMRSRSELGSPALASWSKPHASPASPDEGRHHVEEEVVWEHGSLLDYRIVNGKPFVLVPWRATWEPPEEYPEEEVDKVRRRYLAKIQGRRRGRPHVKQQN